MSEEEKGFVVKDRRIFTDEDKEAEGKDESARTQPSTDGDVPPEPTAEKTREPETAEPSKSDASEEQPQFPEINFPTFVVSLNASTLLHLGAIEDPTSGQKTKNLPMAKQTITVTYRHQAGRRTYSPYAIMANSQKQAHKTSFLPDIQATGST